MSKVHIIVETLKKKFVGIGVSQISRFESSIKAIDFEMWKFLINDPFISPFSFNNDGVLNIPVFHWTEDEMEKV